MTPLDPAHAQEPDQATVSALREELKDQRGHHQALVTRIQDDYNKNVDRILQTHKHQTEATQKGHDCVVCSLIGVIFMLAVLIGVAFWLNSTLKVAPVVNI